MADADEGMVDIVRASARIQIDFLSLSKDDAREARRQLLDARRQACTGANAVLRALRRLDEDALDAFMREHGRMPQKGVEWKPPTLKSRGYTLVTQVVPELGTAIAVTAANMADKRWRQDRWNALVRQLEAPPHYRVTLPIELHLNGVKLRNARFAAIAAGETDKATIKALDGRWWLDLALRSEKAPRAHGERLRVSVPLTVKDEYQENILVKCFTGVWKMGQPRIAQDAKRPARWYVRFAYKRRVPRLENGRHAAIHRGIRCAVVAVVEGVREPWIYDGYAIEAYLRQIQRRRREYQNDSVGAGRSGRGRKRVLRPTKRLEKAAANWRQTKNQTIARRLARWLHSKGVTSYTVEDLSGIRNGEPERVGVHVWERVQEWPYFDLGMRLQACLEELGIVDRTEVDAAYLSQRCPACGNINPDSVDLKGWKHKCSACGFCRHLDVSAGLNVLARGGAKRQGDEARYAELCGRDPEKPAPPPRKTKKKRLPPAPKT